MENIETLRSRFRAEAAKSWPGIAYPEVCWVFSEVLGIDPRVMPVDQAITKKTYKVFVHEEIDGQIRVKIQGDEPFVVTRKFTPQQERDLREWWPMLPDELKVPKS